MAALDTAELSVQEAKTELATLGAAYKELETAVTDLEYANTQAQVRK